jgi:histidine triad (HIT) family protein
MMGCPFCRIISGEIPAYRIWEDDEFYAMLDINPIKPGHTLLIPKRHADSVFDLDDQWYTQLFLRAKMLSAPLQRATGAKRIGIAVEGFCVPHIHVHLVPVNHGNELNPEHSRPAEAAVLENMARRVIAELDQKVN